MVEGNEATAFVLLDLRGRLSGYVQSICVRPDRRGRGLGTALIGWAEERIGRESPNVFLCSSSFNAGAQRLYEGLGYELVGRLTDFVVPGMMNSCFEKLMEPGAASNLVACRKRTIERLNPG